MTRTTHITTTRNLSMALIALLALFAAACGGAIGAPAAIDTRQGGAASTVTTPPATTPEPTIEGPGYSTDPGVNGILASLATWDPAVQAATDTRELRAGAFREGNFNYQCTVGQGEQNRRFDEFPAVAFQGSLLPGLFIDGGELLAGKIQPLPLDRAPLKLVISLASENPVVEVDYPSTATIQQAVSLLQRDADSRLSGIDVVPADIEYVRKEAYAFEQTALELGFSLRYAGPLFQAGLDTAFRSQDSFKQHTILVRMVQPMYTISFVDDSIFEPRQLLGPGVTAGQVNAAIAAGRLQEDRPAVYVRSVTYGRTMLFTMTSSEVDSSSDLLVAMNAAYGAFSGSGSVSEKHREVLANTEIRLVAVGGDTASAEAAIKSANPSDYFNGANTANAAPLSFRVATLGGGQAAVEDSISFQQQDCSRSPYVAPKPTYAFRFVVSQVQGTATIQLNDSVKATASGYNAAPGSTEYTFQGNNLPAGNQAIWVNFGRAWGVDAKVNVKVYVNGKLVDEQAFHDWAVSGWFGWTINKDTGRVTYKG